MLFLSALRVAREVEKQACLPTDGQKEIFIWSPHRGLQERTRRASSAHARTVLRRGGNIISLTVVTLFFAAAVRELGIKGLAVRW